LLTDGKFWVSAFERAIKTAAQVAIGLFAAGVTILDIDWGQGLAVVATAAVLSLLSSVASDRLGKWPGPSLADEAVVELDEAHL